jgi:hypothetical protein
MFSAHGEVQYPVDMTIQVVFQTTAGMGVCAEKRMVDCVQYDTPFHLCIFSNEVVHDGRCLHSKCDEGHMCV